MLITAKFQSICKVCQLMIQVDERISWDRNERGVAHAICSEEGQKTAQNVAASNAVTSDIEVPTPEGFQFYPFQLAGINYALNRQGTLIADEMGLGKTPQACGVINADPNIQSVLVICPKSLKENWRRECERWLTREIDLTITNYEQLSKLPGRKWDLIVVDEAHYCKNPKSQRSKAVKALAKKCGKRLLLTGSPILAKPIELWPLLQIVDPEAWDPAGFVKRTRVPAGEGGGFWRFAKHYCNAHQEEHGYGQKHWVFDGATNLDELNERLRATCMIRRTKAQVLTDLPPKTRQIIPIEATMGLTEEAEFVQAHGPVKNWTPKEFTEYSRVRRELAIAKVPAALEFIKEALDDTDHQLVIFAHHHEVIDLIHEDLTLHLPKVTDVVVIDGRTSEKDRQLAIDEFQTSQARVIICSIQAAGVGITLTAANHEIFVERDWTPAIVTQAEDRCHRIGQRENVLVQHLVVEGSLDDEMTKLLVKKQDIADRALEIEHTPKIEAPINRIASKEYNTCNDRRPLISFEEKLKIHDALRFLARHCDGAQQLDDVGFNRLDTNFGHSLAAQQSLSDKQAIAARKMLVKYKNQLERGGIVL